MNTNRQILLNDFTTLAAFLACVASVNFNHQSPGAFSLGLENLKERVPPCIRDRAAEPAVLEHPCDVQALRSDQSVSVNEMLRNFVVHVPAAVRDLRVQPLDLELGFASAIPAFLLSGEVTLDNAEASQRRFEVADVAERLAVGRGDEGFQANVDPDSARLVVDDRIGEFNRERDIPLAGSPDDGRGLDLSIRWKFAVPADADCPDVLESQFVVYDLCPVRIPEHKRVESVGRLKSRKAWGRSTFNPGKESLERLVQFSQGLLSGRCIHRREMRIELPLNRQPSGLLVEVPVLSMKLPTHDPAIKGSVVESPVSLQRPLKFAALVYVREQAVSA